MATISGNNISVVYPAVRQGQKSIWLQNRWITLFLILSPNKNTMVCDFRHEMGIGEKQESSHFTSCVSIIRAFSTSAVSREFHKSFEKAAPGERFAFAIEIASRSLACHSIAVYRTANLREFARFVCLHLLMMIYIMP
jgi:hypothetical protein